MCGILGIHSQSFLSPCLVKLTKKLPFKNFSRKFGLMSHQSDKRCVLVLWALTIGMLWRLYPTKLMMEGQHPW